MRATKKVMKEAAAIIGHFDKCCNLLEIVRDLDFMLANDWSNEAVRIALEWYNGQLNLDSTFTINEKRFIKKYMNC